MPEPGEMFHTLTWDWVWVPPDGVKRGRWRSETRPPIEIFPPSGGSTSWTMVMQDLEIREEIIIEWEKPEDAFYHASQKIRQHAN